MTMKNNLKKCPFCGGEPHLKFFHTGEWNINCWDCSASTEMYSNKQTAIDVWNKRTIIKIYAPNVEKELEKFKPYMPIEVWNDIVSTICKRFPLIEDTNKVCTRHIATVDSEPTNDKF